MRQITILVPVFIAAASGLGLSAQHAVAAPRGALAATIPSPSLVELAGSWRRYCRRYGCEPGQSVPEVAVDVDAGGDVDADAEAPAIVVLPPPRPLSCGEFRYWNGTACVDARYNTPYLGPK